MITHLMLTVDPLLTYISLSPAIFTLGAGEEEEIGVLSEGGRGVGERFIEKAFVEDVLT